MARQVWIWNGPWPAFSDSAPVSVPLITLTFLYVAAGQCLCCSHCSNSLSLELRAARNFFPTPWRLVLIYHKMMWKIGFASIINKAKIGEKRKTSMQNRIVAGASFLPSYMLLMLLHVPVTANEIWGCRGVEWGGMEMKGGPLWFP